MSRYIPVEPEKWAEMVAALALVPKLQAKIEELNQRWPNYHVDALIKAEAEMAGLKAEVEEWQRAEAAVGEKVIEVCEENVRLKAEVEVQNQRINRRDEDVGRLSCENARLKAEVERLRHFEGVASSVDFYQQENARLKAEVERLRKAGDELYDWAGAEDCPQRVYDAWNAAKEGKPSV